MSHTLAMSQAEKDVLWDTHMEDGHLTAACALNIHASYMCFDKPKSTISFLLPLQ